MRNAAGLPDQRGWGGGLIEAIHVANARQSSLKNSQNLKTFAAFCGDWRALAVNRVMAEALSAGATLIKPAQETFWGGYSGYFRDPDGFLWEVAHVPQFWIGPEENKRV
ncbi:MAG: hypothetical protein JAZ16_10865 [Candidatus Thiodiazotropha taylori]|nr:hypothetical protein [Candidatus Thiodiazotropha taylori]